MPGGTQPCVACLLHCYVKAGVLPVFVLHNAPDRIPVTRGEDQGVVDRQGWYPHLHHPKQHRGHDVGLHQHQPIPGPAEQVIRYRWVRLAEGSRSDDPVY